MPTGRESSRGLPAGRGRSGGSGKSKGKGGGGGRGEKGKKGSRSGDGDGGEPRVKSAERAESAPTPKPVNTVRAQSGGGDPALESRATRKKQRTRVFSASIPVWMSAEVEPDVLAMGVGPHHHGGTQGIGMVALGMYLAIPAAERRELAQLALPAFGAESLVRAKLARLWPVRLVKTLGLLERDEREHEVETLERAVREMGEETE